MRSEEVRETVRVSDAADRVGYGHDGNARLWVRYQLGPWVATVHGEVGAPTDGPTNLSVGLDMSDAGLSPFLDDEVPSAGITTDVLRNIPLGDARKVLRRLRSTVMAERDQGVFELPERMNSLEDWAAFARAYARSAARSPSHPAAHLARATDLGMSTISARVRRAVELGLLEESTHNWLVLTEYAKKLEVGDIDDDG